MKDSRERGAVVVEFAIIVPLFLLLILGLVEFGYRYQRAAVLNNAAFIGARDFSIHQDPGRAQDAAELANDGPLPGFAVAENCASPDPDVVKNVTVTFAFTEDSPTKFFGTDTFTIDAKGVARCEG